MLYDLPKYYDIAFSRDISGEMEFFINCFKKYANFEVKRILEPACGSGIFLTAFPKFGYHITGYDISPNMVSYAEEQIRKAGYTDKAKVLPGDMRTMKFDTKFDAAINLISSLSYCTSDEDLRNHFRVMSESLRKGGIYIIEILCACEDIKNERTPDETWLAERDKIKIEAFWHPDNYDIENKIRHIIFRMKVKDNDKILTFEEGHDLRLWFFEDLKRLTQEVRFRIEAIYNQKYELISADSHITGELGALYYILINE